MVFIPNTESPSTWAAHLLLLPSLNVPDGRLSDDEPNTVVRERSVQYQTGIVPLTPLLLGLTRACPHTQIACSPTLAPKKFLDFLRAVRTFRCRERPFTRNERLSHRGRILGRNVRLQWVVVTEAVPIPTQPSNPEVVRRKELTGRFAASMVGAQSRAPRRTVVECALSLYM